MSNQPLKVEHSTATRQFYIAFEDGSRSLLDYAMETPGVYEFYHTETPSHLRGKGYAAIVSTAAMEWIKENEYKAHFTCSYLINDFLPRNPQWKDWVVEE